MASPRAQKPAKNAAVVRATTGVARIGVGTYTVEKGTAICDLLSVGRSLNSICREEGMPDKKAVLKWLAAEPEFVVQYARARELQADHLFDECLDIVDDGRNDWMERQAKDGSTELVPNPEAVARSRLRLDARKWMAGKLRPKKYGDKQINEHTGPDGEALTLGSPITIFQLPDNGRG